MCQLRFVSRIFETIRLIANVAARLPADVTRCVCPAIGTCRNVGSNFSKVTCIMIVNKGMRRPTRRLLRETSSTYSSVSCCELALNCIDHCLRVGQRNLVRFAGTTKVFAGTISVNSNSKPRGCTDQSYVRSCPGSPRRQCALSPLHLEKESKSVYLGMP